MSTRRLARKLVFGDVPLSTQRHRKTKRALRSRRGDDPRQERGTAPWPRRRVCLLSSRYRGRMVRLIRAKPMCWVVRRQRRCHEQAPVRQGCGSGRELVPGNGGMGAYVSLEGDWLRGPTRRTAGGHPQVVDQPVVSDDNLITSRKPADIPAFSAAIVEALPEATADRPAQTRAA